MQVTAIESADELVCPDLSGPVTPVTVEDDRHHAPDAHFTVTTRHGLLARCSCWWRTVPHFEHERLGLVGHYAASDEPSGRAILRRACERLKAEGCTLAVGPLDGSTWRRYRFITERGSEPPFVLEPENPDTWPSYFLAEGFTEFAGYRSALTIDLETAGEDARALDEYLRDVGVTVRPFDPARAAQDLTTLYRISIGSFSNNLLYTPIDEAEFGALYGAILPLVSPEHVSIAELAGQPVGFLFAIPDVLEAGRTPNGSIRTIVLKTIAVLPQWRGMGIGRLLFARAHAIARRHGFSRAIHALMQGPTDVSLRMSGGSAQTIRRYSLFARSL